MSRLFTTTELAALRRQFLTALIGQEISEEAEQALAEALAAMVAAGSAQTTAEEAQGEAGTAQVTAGTAQAVAVAAQATANDAQVAAAAAQATADAAEADVASWVTAPFNPPPLLVYTGVFSVTGTGTDVHELTFENGLLTGVVTT